MKLYVQGVAMVTGTVLVFVLGCQKNQPRSKTTSDTSQNQGYTITTIDKLRKFVGQTVHILTPKGMIPISIDAINEDLEQPTLIVIDHANKLPSCPKLESSLVFDHNRKLIGVVRQHDTYYWSPSRLIIRIF